MRAASVICACLLCTGAVAETASGAPDTLVGSLQRTWLEVAAIDGTAASVDWVRAFRVDANASIGLAWKEIGPYRRTLIDVASSVSLPARFRLSGGLKLGPVTDGASHYNHSQSAISLMYTASPWAFGGIEHQYVDSGPLHGQLVSAAVTVLPARRLSVEGKQTLTAAGNLGTRVSSVRLDYFGALHWLAGAAVGRSAPHLMDTPTLLGGEYTEYYAGLAVPVRRSTLTIVLDRYRTSASTQYSATMVLSAPAPWGR